MKTRDKEEITKQDLVALTFAPIMGGKLTNLDKILKSIRLVKKIDNEYRYDMESMLYAFADKFLDGKELEKVKEEISMTKIGEMLVEDGIKKGKEEQATDTAIKAIEMGLENDAISKLTGLTDKEINILRRAKSN
jgi:hypothetical protein